jgi:hypothetical protein
LILVFNNKVSIYLLFLNKNLILIVILSFILYFYLSLIGEGYILTMVHSMMNSTGPEGAFYIEKGGSAVIDCAELHKKFPELVGVDNAITKPTPLNDGSGLFKRYLKADKSIIDASALSWKDKLGVNIASTEARCGRSLSIFINAVVTPLKNSKKSIN